MLKMLFPASGLIAAILLLPALAQAQVKPSPKPKAKAPASTLIACESCTPAQKSAIQNHLNSVYLRFPSLQKMKIKVDHDAEELNGTTFTDREIDLDLPSGTTAREAGIVISHEFGHQVFSDVLKKIGLGAVEKFDSAIEQREDRSYTPEEWAPAKGSCEDDDQLVGLYLAFHELAADTFAYFFYHRDPRVLAQNLIASGYEEEAANRYFDRQMTDEQVLEDLEDEPNEVGNQPYSALSQVKVTIHQQVSRKRGVGSVLYVLGRRFKATWEKGCGVTPFNTLRDQIRADLAKLPVN